MEHQLSITSPVDPQVITVTAETTLGSFPLLAFPDSFEGKLVDVPLEKIMGLKFTPGVLVSVSGKRYKFERLEGDGTFVLRKDW
jgi:hypothetical protein